MAFSFVDESSCLGKNKALYGFWVAWPTWSVASLPKRLLYRYRTADQPFALRYRRANHRALLFVPFDKLRTGFDTSARTDWVPLQQPKTHKEPKITILNQENGDIKLFRRTTSINRHRFVLHIGCATIEYGGSCVALVGKGKRGLLTKCLATSGALPSND
jgi:hypothetical protein